MLVVYSNDGVCNLGVPPAPPPAPPLLFCTTTSTVVAVPGAEPCCCCAATAAGRTGRLSCGRPSFRSMGSSWKARLLLLAPPLLLLPLPGASCSG